MPFALIIAGIVLTVAGVRSTENTLFSLLKNDFTGTPSFIWWTLSILAIGSVGYLPGMRQLANAFLALILIVLVLANNQGKNIFADFFASFQNIPPAPVQSNGVVSSLSNSVSGLFSGFGSLKLFSGDMTPSDFGKTVGAMSNLGGL